jgi:hypothetical protein
MKSPHAAFGVFAGGKSGGEQLIEDLRMEAGNCRRDVPAHPNYLAGLLLLAADALTEARAEIKMAQAAIGKRVGVTPGDDETEETTAPPPAGKHRHRFVDENATKCTCGAYKRGHAPATPAAGGAP